MANTTLEHLKKLAALHKKALTSLKEQQGKKDISQQEQPLYTSTQNKRSDVS